MSQVTILAGTNVYPRKDCIVGTQTRRFETQQKFKLGQIATVELIDGGSKLYAVCVRDIGWVKAERLSISKDEFDAWLKDNFSGFKNKTIQYPKNWK